MAITRDGLGTASALMIHSPTTPVIDRSLLDHRWNRIASELGTLVGLQQDAAREQQLQKRLKERKSPSEHFGGGIAKVIRLCGVDSEETLPNIWGVLAKVSPKQHQCIIQQHINDMPDDLADGLAVIVTPTLSKKVTTLEFVMGTKEAL